MYLTHCKHCNAIIPPNKKNNKFCNSSCAASCNNKGRRRHGSPPGECKQCGNPKATAGQKFCSQKCASENNRKIADPIAYRRLISREANARYRAKLKNQTPMNVDRAAIREFYSNCPVGYEVDHIIPISKGGTHSLENLQYLTTSENRKKHNKI